MYSLYTLHSFVSDYIYLFRIVKYKYQFYVCVCVRARVCMCVNFYNRIISYQIILLVIE